MNWWRLTRYGDPIMPATSWWMLILDGKAFACIEATDPMHVMQIIGDLFYGGKGCGEFVSRGRGLFEFNVYNDCWEYRSI